MKRAKYFGLSLLVISTLSLGLTGCGGGGSSSEEPQAEETIKLDTTKAISNLTTTLPDGSDNIPLNENIELKDNVKVLSQDDIDNMTIEQDETDSDKFTITIGEQSSNTRSMKSLSRNTRAVEDYSIGDIIMLGKDVVVAISNPLNFGYKVISKNGSQITVKAISNICEALNNGTLSNNPKTLAPFQNNSTISYKKFSSISKETGEDEPIIFGTTLVHKLSYEIIPTITLQCRNSELYYMNAGIGGHIDWESSLFDASSYESEEVEIPLAITQIPIGKAKIGLFLEFRPSVDLNQNIYNSPKLTLNKEFSFLRTYIDGSWSNNEYSKNDMSETKPTFTGVKQNPTTPTMSVSLNGKFYVGLGGKVNKKGAEAGMSATIIPTLALKDKDNCKFIDNDMDAKLEVGFDSVLGGYAYAPDYLSWKLYDDVKIIDLSCDTTNPTTNLNDGLVAHYEFEGNANDSSGNGNHGTEYGGVVYVDGVIGKGVNFKTNQDGIKMFDQNYSETIVNNFSYGAWFKTFTEHQIDAEYSRYGGVSGQKYLFHPDWYENELINTGSGISIGTNGISVYEHSHNYMPATAVLKYNFNSLWNYVVIVYINRIPYIYLNGNIVYSGNTSNSQNVHIPRYLGEMAYGTFTGILDNVRIYNRAISESEIQELYNLGQ